MKTPTFLEIYNGEFGEPVYSHSDTSWRHGEYRTEVYYLEGDKTYWRVKYRLSCDGETNELREGLALIKQVWPEEKTVVVYSEHPC